MGSLLDRALAAEDRADQLEERVKDLETRLKGALNADPTTAIRALSWMYRAENGERLIQEIVRDHKLNSIDLPAGWLARAEAQLAALAILKRDQEAIAERPGDNESWETMENGQVRRVDRS